MIIIFENPLENRFSIEQEISTNDILKLKEKILCYNLKKEGFNVIKVNDSSPPKKIDEKKETVIIKPEVLTYKEICKPKKIYEQLTTNKKIINVIKKCFFVDNNSEFVFQKFELPKDINKIINSMKKVEKLNENHNKVSGIHINLDKRTFLSSTLEIYKENKELFDTDKIWRNKNYFLEKKSNNIISEKDIYPRKKNILEIYPERIEFRCFDSNNEGINKTKKFLESTVKIDKKIKKEYNITYLNLIKNLTNKETLTTTNETKDLMIENKNNGKNILNGIKIYKDLDDFMEKCEKREDPWIILDGITATEEGWKKIFN